MNAAVQGILLQQSAAMAVMSVTVNKGADKTRGKESGRSCTPNIRRDVST